MDQRDGGIHRIGSPSFQQWSGLVEVRRIEPGKLDEPSGRVERDITLAHGHQAVFAKLAQDAIDVDGAEASPREFRGGDCFRSAHHPAFPATMRASAGPSSALNATWKQGCPKMSPRDDHAGRAALSICEALMLAMNDHKLLPEAEIMGVLHDAAATHENATGTEAETESHRAVATIIIRISAGGNSVRRPPK